MLGWSRRRQVRPRVDLVTPDEPTPEGLLELVSNGDQAAFSALYERFSPRVFGLANRIIRDTSQAEEVAQEIFLEIWQRASRFDRARGTATSWIMTLTHGRSVDRVRQSQASRNRDLKSAVGNFDRDVDSVADSVGAALRRDRRCASAWTPSPPAARNRSRWPISAATPSARSVTCSARPCPPSRPGCGTD